MTKDQFIQAVAKAADTKQNVVRSVIEAIHDVIASHIKAGDTVGVAPLGIFKPVHSEARQGHNPRTGETMEIPAKNSVKFSISSSLKNAVK